MSGCSSKNQTDAEYNPVTEGMDDFFVRVISGYTKAAYTDVLLCVFNCTFMRDTRP